MAVYTVITLDLGNTNYYHNCRFVLINVDDEVSTSCTTMNYFDEASDDYSADADYIACLDKGGSYVYSRQMTHYGTCAAEIPCDYVTEEDTKIYEYVCDTNPM